MQGLGGLRSQALTNPCCLQTVSDIEHGWILVNKEQHRQLKSLQEKVSKKEVGQGIGAVLALHQPSPRDRGTAWCPVPGPGGRQC